MLFGHLHNGIVGRPTSFRMFWLQTANWLKFAFVAILIFRGFANAASPAKKLIEFGWDEPDTTFMLRHVQEMEQRPFDGCVYHIRYLDANGRSGDFSLENWGHRSFSTNDLKTSIEELKRTKFRKFRHNFLRFNVLPGDVDWFDDFSPILNNARLAASVARQATNDGILLDVEQYKAPLFDARRQWLIGSKTFLQYSDQVRKRGSQLMEAFQQGFPNITILLTFGYSLPWNQSQAGKKDLALVEYGLLAPFLDGMVDAANGKARIVDGHEFGYHYGPGDFTAGYHQMKTGVLPIVRQRAKYVKVFSFGFGIWLDLDSQQRGWFVDKVENNPHSPREFGALVREALDVSDEYVWIYSQIPRWWSEPRGEMKDLPREYMLSLEQVRTR
jgi:hypothetical protein